MAGLEIIEKLPEIILKGKEEAEKMLKSTYEG